MSVGTSTKPRRRFVVTLPDGTVRGTWRVSTVTTAVIVAHGPEEAVERYRDHAAYYRQRATEVETPEEAAREIARAEYAEAEAERRSGGATRYTVEGFYHTEAAARRAIDRDRLRGATITAATENQ